MSDECYLLGDLLYLGRLAVPLVSMTGLLISQV